MGFPSARTYRLRVFGRCTQEDRRDIIKHPAVPAWRMTALVLLNLKDDDFSAPVDTPITICLPFAKKEHPVYPDFTVSCAGKKKSETNSNMMRSFASTSILDKMVEEEDIDEQQTHVSLQGPTPFARHDEKSNDDIYEIKDTNRFGRNVFSQDDCINILIPQNRMSSRKCTLNIRSAHNFHLGLLNTSEASRAFGPIALR
jgi:hypothetical protein